MATNTTVKADPNAPAITQQLAQFAVGHPSRARVEAMVDNSIDEASADIHIETTDGRQLHIFIEHAIGSVQRPISEAQLKVRFVDQSEPVLGREKSEKAWGLAAGIGASPDLKSLLLAATPAAWVRPYGPPPCHPLLHRLKKHV